MKRKLVRISESELKHRLAIAHLSPMTAHIPIMGLVLYPGQYVQCELCGGEDAPIVDGKHLPGYCETKKS